MVEEYYEEVTTRYKISIVETYEKEWAFVVLLPGPFGEMQVDFLPDLRFDTYDNAERHLHTLAHLVGVPAGKSRVRAGVDII